MGAGELNQLDERLREVSEGVVAIKTSLQILEGTVSMMNRALFQGNGKPSLMTRVEMLEQKSKPNTEKNDDQRTLIVVERWKAITAIVTALLASPVLIAIVAALLNR